MVLASEKAKTPKTDELLPLTGHHTRHAFRSQEPRPSNKGNIQRVKGLPEGHTTVAWESWAGCSDASERVPSLNSSILGLEPKVD